MIINEILFDFTVFYFSDFLFVISHNVTNVTKGSHKFGVVTSTLNWISGLNKLTHNFEYFGISEIKKGVPSYKLGFHLLLEGVNENYVHFMLFLSPMTNGFFLIWLFARRTLQNNWRIWWVMFWNAHISN